MKKQLALILGAITHFIYLYVETNNGVGRTWNFSPEIFGLAWLLKFHNNPRGNTVLHTLNVG